MCKKLTNILLALTLIFPILANAQLVDEIEINKWGYTTTSYIFSNREMYIVETQIINSKKHAPSLKNHYYTYSLVLECYPEYYLAFKRKLGLIILDEKDYTLSDLSGKCVRIINTAAKFATYKELPRIFSLFEKNLEKIHLNKVLNQDRKTTL